MEREIGFYWVKTLPDNDWEPASWTGSDWLCIGHELEITHVAEVDERPIYHE